MRDRKCKPLLIIIVSCLFLTTDSCDNSTNIVYSDIAYAVDFSTVIKGVIWDEGKPYTPQAYKRKMLNKSITDTNELRRRTITDDFLINIIYCGRGGLYGYIVTSMSTYLTYEIISIDTIKAKGGRKIQKDKIYRLSIVPYFTDPRILILGITQNTCILMGNMLFLHTTWELATYTFHQT